jgi:iron complex outermembrane receptor protein
MSAVSRHLRRTVRIDRTIRGRKQFKELKTSKLFASVCACMGLGSVGLAGVAHAQDASLEEIVITGSRIVRRDFNAPSPILTVDTEAFEQNSAIGLEAVLNQYPQFSPGATQFTASDIQPTAQNSPGASTLNMRGLGAGRSLVLLDGRRAQPVNAAMTVDINTLPAAAIAGVEVISGGAAATYGPDAMAGVVNFRLRRDFEGVDLNYQTGATEAGDGEETRIDALLGISDASGRGNAMFGVGYGSRELALQNNRSFFRDRLSDPGTNANYIFVDYPSYVPAATNLPTQAAVNQVMPAGSARNSAFFVNPATGTIFRTTNALASGYDGSTTVPYIVRPHNGALQQNMIETWLSSPMSRTSLFGRGIYDLTDNLTVYVQGNHNRSTVEQQLAPTSATATSATLPRSPALEPENLRVLLDSRADANAPWTMQRLPNYFPMRGATSDTEVSEIVVGLEGQLAGDWTWEAYHQRGQTNLLTRMENFIWVERLRTVLAQPNLGRNSSFTVSAANDPVSRTYTCTSGIPVFEPWTFTYDGDLVYSNGFELSADCVDAISAPMTQRNVIEQEVTEANFQGKLADMRAGELRGAFGISSRTNYSLFEPDPLFIATQRAEGETQVDEIYGEILAPLFGRFELEIGARYSDFQTGDWQLDAKSYKALFNWAASDAYRFRGGWQRANRVPNVSELYGGVTSSVFGWGATSDICMNNTLSPWGNRADNPNRAQVQELCRQLIYASGGIPGQTDYDVQGADNYPNDGRALPHSYRLLAGGNPRLGSETGDTWTAGMVWQAQGDRNLSISADWYKIEIDQVVASLGFLAAYQQCFNANGTSNPTYNPQNEYCLRITRDPVNSEPLIVYGGNYNFSQRITSGVDISVNWSMPMSNFGIDVPGEFGVRSAANKLLSWKQPQFQEPESPLIEYAGYGTDANTGGFDYQLFTTIYYQGSQLNVGLNWNHMSEQKPLALAVSPETTVFPTESYDLFNLNGSWQFSDRLRLRGGIDNVFNTDPPLTSRDPFNPGNPSNGTGVTSAANYDALGRRYFVGVAMSF